MSLEIGKGLFGLLGPNGAGKSSLMRTIATLQEPDAGTIVFNGHDVLSDPRGLRRQLGYLPQDFGVYPRIPALDLLDHLAVLKGVRDKSQRTEQVHSLLQLTNLYDVRKRAVSTYSGGMKQLSDLCSRMAVLAGGRVLLEGKPAELIGRLEGRIWRKTIRKDAVAHYRASHSVLSTRLFAGETRIHVLADERPEEGSERISTDLEARGVVPHLHFAAVQATLWQSESLILF